MTKQSLELGHVYCNDQSLYYTNVLTEDLWDNKIEAYEPWLLIKKRERKSSMHLTVIYNNMVVCIPFLGLEVPFCRIA